jgi:colicin import membrane protein
MNGNSTKIILLFVVLGLLAAPVFAQQASNTTADERAAINESEVGDVPGDLFYGPKRFFEAVDVAFTFDKAEKAKKEARYSERRAHEAYVLAGKAAKFNAEGRNEDADAAINEIDKLADEQKKGMEDAQADLDSAVESGDANETDIEEVEETERNSIAVLQRVYEKAPEQAKDALLNALNNSIQNQERHEQKMADKGREGKDGGDGSEESDEGNETDEIEPDEINESPAENDSEGGSHNWESGNSFENETEDEAQAGHGKGHIVGINETKDIEPDELNETSVEGEAEDGGDAGEHESSDENETEGDD